MQAWTEKQFKIVRTIKAKKNPSAKWELYDLKDPESVDKRRAAVGMGPLAEYLKRFDVEFDVEQID